MALLSFFTWLNDYVLSIPIVIIFFSVGVFLTLITCFIQLRAVPTFISLLRSGVKRKKEGNTINSFHALFTAMATTIGMGNVVGPSTAIMLGGPGALFWILVYIFFGSVIKFTEVTFAVATRTITDEGKIIGGPMQYLKEISLALAKWYNICIIFLLLVWTSLQSNTLANILVLEGVPAWYTGLFLSILSLMVLNGGAKRVGFVASKLVPIMFILYMTFALFILFQDCQALSNAIKLVINNIFSPAAPVGGFAGATVFYAMRIGLLRGILITEAGVGTSAIPHALSDARRPIDQGILAMYSMVSDATLSIISGLIVLVTNVWTVGTLRSTLIYEAFRSHSPFIGRYVLVISISLFVTTTVIGNSFNGMQSYNALTRYKWVWVYITAIILIIFCGALIPMPLAWEIADAIMVFVAIPNLMGLIVLAMKRRNTLKI